MEIGEEKNRQRHGWSTRRVNKTQKKVISLAKGKKQKEFASDLNDPNQQNEIFRIAKHIVQERQDITGSNCLKGVAEMIQTTGDIGTQWILNLCNAIVKEGCIPDDFVTS